jgi:ATP-dependent RNA helicase RhlE
MKFVDLRLSEPILRAVTAEGYTTPSPIQAQAIPHVLEGRDLLGVAQTGTGKTAAFALPILHRLTGAPVAPGNGRRVRCLVLSPTRELASQIGDSFRTYGKNTTIRHSVMFGGVGQNAQIQALRHGVDVLVATPGRLLDLMNQGYVDLKAVEVFVLDEADRMLDMGFIADIRRIIPKLPRERQTLMFSATMPKDIRELAGSILRNPVSVQVAPVSSTAERIEQSVYFVEKRNKPRLLAHLLNNTAFSRCLVFTRTKHGADRVAKHLQKVGIPADAIHGNKSQNQRERALANFKSGKTPVLIASDIASRGIDIDDISHVVNYDLSNEPETYVHRIGRTGRAGASGVAVSFCDHEERSYLNAIEKLIRDKLIVKTDHPTYPAGSHEPAERERRQPSREPRRPQRAAHAPHTPRQSAGHSQGQGNRTPGGGAGVSTGGSVQRPRQAQRTPQARQPHPLHTPAGSSPGAAPRSLGFHGRKRKSFR